MNVCTPPKTTRLRIIVWSIVAALGIATYNYVLVHYGRTPPHGQPALVHTQIRTLGCALIIYAEEQGGVFPPGHWDQDADRPYWVTALFRCPPLTFDPDMLRSPYDSSAAPTSYQMNPEVAGTYLSDYTQAEQQSTVLLATKAYVDGKAVLLYMDRTTRTISERDLRSFRWIH